MKKWISILLVLSMLLTVSAALAEGMQIQLIGGPEEETVPVELDDMKLNVDAEIDGWGILTLTGFEIQDGQGYYKSGYDGKLGGGWYGYHWSGEEAEFIILYADILNNTLNDKDYLENVSVRVFYDDAYEYGGGAYQRNFNNESDQYCYKLDADAKNQAKRWFISEADQFAIRPMYEGHYIFACTLPNAVINSKAPLRMVITIDGNEITYNIRK